MVGAQGEIGFPGERQLCFRDGFGQGVPIRAGDSLSVQIEPPVRSTPTPITVGGITTPSSTRTVAPGAMEAGAMPPISAWCTCTRRTPAARPTRRGRVRSRSRPAGATPRTPGDW